jgi:hypothetical protein
VIIVVVVQLFDQRFYNIVYTSNLHSKSKQLKHSTIVNDVLAGSVPTVYESFHTNDR